MNNHFNTHDNTMNGSDLGCASHHLADEACTPQQLDIDIVSMKLVTKMNGTPLSLFVGTGSGTGTGAEVGSATESIGFLPSSSPPNNPLGSMMALSLALSLSTMIALALALTLRKLSRAYRLRQTNLFCSSTNLPPCAIKPHFIFGHLPHIFSPPDSDEFRSVFVDHADASGISTFWFLNEPSVSVLKAEHVRAVLRSNIEREGNSMITRHFKRCLGEDSLVMYQGGESDRERWRHHRNLVKVAFTTHAVENMANKVWAVANSFSSSISQQCETNSKYCQEADDIFKWATTDVFGKVAFNYNFGCTETLTTTPLAHSLNYTIEDSNMRAQPKNLLNPLCQFYWIPTKRNRDFNHHSDNVHGLLSKICQTRWKEIKSGKSELNDDHDLLAALLKSKADSSNGEEIDETHDDLVKLLLTLFFAGYDTSSVLLSMVMWSIVQNPKIQEECAREAHAASTSTDGGDSLHEDASKWESKLAYCKAVISETARLHPPVYTNCRNLSKDMELDGYTIPKRTKMYLPIMLIHTDERNFARPTEFLPERWVRRDASTGRWVERDHRTEPSFVENDPTYLPPANPHCMFTFSDGARNCVGHRLAMQESTILFACLVRDFTINVRDGFVMQKRKKFALAPPEQMPLIFKKRQWESQE